VVLVRLTIEEHDPGDAFVEAYYTEDSAPALLALQPGLPAATREARAIEAHGYYRKPPPGRREVCYALGSFDHVDEGTIAAMRRVIEKLLPPENIECIKDSFHASTLGDAFRIAWNCDMHPHTMIAVLRNPEARGELPGE
jgi:hypothetical protein